MRRVLKILARTIATLTILPLVGLYRLAALASSPERALPGWSQALAILPGTWGAYLRVAFYRKVLSHCEADVSIGFGTIFADPDARLGKGAYIGAYCILGRVELGDDVLLASHVSVTSGSRQHGIERTDVPIRLQLGTKQRLKIGPNSWIGERSVVMADVGAHCVVGAGAVVTRPIPAYAVAVGVPARIAHYRNVAEGDMNTCPIRG
jgi:virginiamycin A acetyltransferase